jgi:hypothetical protein
MGLGAGKACETQPAPTAQEWACGRLQREGKSGLLEGARGGFGKEHPKASERRGAAFSKGHGVGKEEFFASATKRCHGRRYKLPVASRIVACAVVAGAASLAPMTLF